MLGSAVGLAFGIWTRELLVKLSPAGIPRLASAHADWRVLLFTLALSLIAGVAFGLFPALQLSRAGAVEAMKSTGRGAAGVMRWRGALMTAEIAVSMILLVGAGLLVRSFLALNRVDLGFETGRVMAMQLRLPASRYADSTRQLAFFDELSRRVEQLPGVEAVAFANHMPMRGGWSSSFLLESGEQPQADAQTVSPGYFETLGIPLMRGRLLTAADRDGSAPVAVVNQRFARSLLRTDDAAGRKFRSSGNSPWVTIVGVVSDVRREGKAAEILPEVYLPAAQGKLWPARLTDFAFRAAGDPKALITAAEQQVWAIDKDQPVTAVRTLEEVVTRAGAARRFQTLVLMLFAGLAMALALVGVYGVVSYSVAQRTPEIGVRIALGASRASILRMVIARAMTLIAVGIVSGAACAFALSRYLGTLLFEIRPTDPVTYASLAATLTLVALAACCIPALRATRIDPMMALRYE